MNIFADSVSWSSRSIHVVSLVHSLIIIVLAVWASDLPALEKDRAFAWDDRVGLVAAIAAGYVVLPRYVCKHSLFTWMSFGFKDISYGTLWMPL